MESRDRNRPAFRQIPPAGGFVSPGRVIDGIFKVGILARKEFRDKLMSYTGASAAITTNSGKEALLRIFELAKAHTVRRSVLVSAYTCPDIATAAIRANFKIYLLDINERTLDVRSEGIEPRIKDNTAFVVLSNLYGLPDKMEPWFNFRGASGCGIIDDACQSLLSRRGEFVVGAMPSTIGVASFGRGKAICGVGGGAILVPASGYSQQADRLIDQAVAGDLRSMKPAAAGGGFGASMKDFIIGTLASLLERPELYSIPARLPFLKLGETEVKKDFPVGRPSMIAMLHALIQLQHAEKTSALLRANALSWADRLSGSTVIQPFLERGGKEDQGIVPIRYPIVFEKEEQCAVVLQALTDAGLGASGSYPETINNYPELRAYVLKSNIASSQTVAQRIITLPVHRGVKEADIDRAAAIIRENS